MKTAILSAAENTTPVSVSAMRYARARVCWFCDFAHAPTAPCLTMGATTQADHDGSATLLSMGFAVECGK